MIQKRSQLLLLGKKIGMTQIYNEAGCLLPVTVVQIEPSPVIQIKTKENDGYNAVQVGSRKNKESRLSKAELGHLKKAKAPALADLKEFRVQDTSQFAIGQVFTVDCFQPGEMVDVIGLSKGHGFQGVVSRYSFAGGPATHGHMSHRRAGSCGMRAKPGHIIKGKRMPGHMGDVRRTIQNLQIVKVLSDKNLLLIKGSVPGANGGKVFVRKAKKGKQVAA
jgi:large subunit ribosomal protein L3